MNDETQPVSFGGVPVEDVFIDWHLTASNRPTMKVYTDRTIPRNYIFDNEPWFAVRDDRWIVMSDGILLGWQEGDSFENRRTYTKDLPAGYYDYRAYASNDVEDADISIRRGFMADQMEGTYMYDHCVSGDAERKLGLGPFATVTYEPADGYGGNVAVTRSKLEQLVDRYINGPLGSDHTSYWCWRRDNKVSSSSWARANSDRSRWEDAEVVECHVRVVPDDIYGWTFTPLRQDETEELSGMGAME